MKKIGVFADFHTGHRVGLTNPEAVAFEIKSNPKQTRQREMLWSWFAENIKKYQPFDYAFFPGDLIEGKGERSGGTELITADREEQCQIAASAIRFISAKKNYITFGTPYHSGVQEDWETYIAKLVDARIENEGHYDINGLIVAMKHHIGNTSSPVSAVTAMTRAQINQSLWAAHDQQPHANLIIRAHIHRCYNIGFPPLNFQGWTCPALQGLGSKYGVRQCDGLPVTFGFLIIEVENKTNWYIRPVIAPLTIQAAHLTKL